LPPSMTILLRRLAKCSASDFCLNKIKTLYL
jgi:hypothetical protein